MKTKHISRLNTATVIEAYSDRYWSILKKIKQYNDYIPHHESTCKPFSREERIVYQKKNIDSLQELARAEGVEKFVRFTLQDRTRIIMFVCGKRYGG